jgi:NitT/TauT family transport system substrate-binding protein
MGSNPILSAMLRPRRVRHGTLVSRRLLLASALAPLVFMRASRAENRQQLKLIVGTSPPDPACHFFYYARDNGFYREAGLEVSISGVTSATNATRAVVSGDADIGWVDGVSALQAREAGARIQCISGFAAHLDYQIVGGKEIASLKDLEGKRFGVATIGGGTYIIPRLLIERAGGDPERVQWLASGNSAARVQAMIAGAIDATITTTTFMPRLMNYARFHLIGDAGKDLPDMVYTWEIANEKALTSRAALAAFIAATARAVRWASINVDAAAALSTTLLPDASKNEITAGIRAYVARSFWSTSGEVPHSMVEFTVATLRRAGQLQKAIAYEDFIAAELAAQSR